MIEISLHSYGPSTRKDDGALFLPCDFTVSGLSDHPEIYCVNMYPESAKSKELFDLKSKVLKRPLESSEKKDFLIAVGKSVLKFHLESLPLS